MFRIALVGCLFLFASWPINQGLKLLETRSNNLHRLQLEAQFQLKKRLLESKDRANELLKRGNLESKINKNQAHSLQAYISGRIKHPDGEFIVIANLDQCNMIATTGLALPVASLCELEPNSFYYMKQMAAGDQSWALQIFPIAGSFSGGAYHLLFGSRISLNWLLPNQKKLIDKYAIALSPPSGSSFITFDKVDPSLRRASLSTGDWVTKINQHFEVLSPRVFNGIQTILFIASLVAFLILLAKFYRSEQTQKSKTEEFNEFLRSGLGLNPKKNSGGNDIDGWLMTLQDVDIKAQNTIRNQKKEIVILRSKANEANLNLKRLQSETAPLQRFKNIQSQFVKFGQKIYRQHANFFDHENKVHSHAFEKLQDGLLKTNATVSRWKAGIDDEGPRRFLRRLYESPPDSKSFENKFEEDLYRILELNQNNLETLEKAKQENESMVESFDGIFADCQMLLGASNSEGRNSVQIDTDLFRKTIHDIIINDLDHSSEISISSASDFSIEVEESFVYPFTLSISQIACAIGEYNKSPVLLQLKHKSSGSNHYVVVLFKSNPERRSSQIIPHTLLDKNINTLEGLLNPIGVESQIIELNSRQLVISLNWKAPERPSSLNKNHSLNQPHFSEDINF